jgi:hypothetical protein
VTDARFSGVSTGACIGHAGPEALAGGPIGKVRDGDLVRIVIDRNKLTGSVDVVGDGERQFSPEEGIQVLATRSPRDDLRPDPQLPADTAEPGAAASTTWTASPNCSPPGKQRWRSARIYACSWPRPGDEVAFEHGRGGCWAR